MQSLLKMRPECLERTGRGHCTSPRHHLRHLQRGSWAPLCALLCSFSIQLVLASENTVNKVRIRPWPLMSTVLTDSTLLLLPLHNFNWLGFATECPAWCLALPRGQVVPQQILQKRNSRIEKEWGNWIFDTCHFHSVAPCSLATHKDFSCHSSACYHEWAQGLRNPITTTVSDPSHHPYVCCTHVPQIREDVPISSFSFLLTSLRLHF